MAIRRSYHDACGMAHALDLVGERWALLVVRELVLGPKRYTDLRADLPGISTTVLAHRLDELEQTGVVRRRRLAPPAGSTVYELTDWGQELEPVIRQLGRWGARSPTRRRDAHLSAAGLVLSLRTNYQPDGSDGFAATIELRLGEDRFTATVRDGQLAVVRGGADEPDAVIEGAPGVLAGVLRGGRCLQEAIRANDLSVRGDSSAIRRFLSQFSLPEPVSGPPPPIDSPEETLLRRLPRE
jgi:DNA-binding HxlR family transcriptional regulator